VGRREGTTQSLTRAKGETEEEGGESADDPENKAEKGKK